MQASGTPETPLSRMGKTCPLAPGVPGDRRRLGLFLLRTSCSSGSGSLVDTRRRLPLLIFLFFRFFFLFSLSLFASSVNIRLTFAVRCDRSVHQHDGALACESGRVRALLPPVRVTCRSTGLLVLLSGLLDPVWRNRAAEIMDGWMDGDGDGDGGCPLFCWLAGARTAQPVLCRGTGVAPARSKQVAPAPVGRTWAAPRVNTSRTVGGRCSATRSQREASGREERRGSCPVWIADWALNRKQGCPRGPVIIV